MAEIRLYQEFKTGVMVEIDNDGHFEEETSFVKVFAPFDYDKFITCLERYRGDAEKAGNNAINALLEKAISEATGNVDIMGGQLGYCRIEFLPVRE